jgi:HEPN domain-containing protein
MMLRTEMDHIPLPIRDELVHVASVLFEAFSETTKGRLSEHYRAGRILSLVLHGPHAERVWEDVAPGEAYRVLAIVNYPRLARSERDWKIVRDRLRRAWEFGEITRPVRLAVESLERLNGALIDGVPYFVTIAERGIALYQMDGFQLRSPRRLEVQERSVRGLAEYLRWHRRGCDFLAGAGFYRDRGDAPLAALLLHQACEHFYQAVLWSITHHGPRTHALEELREAAEALAPGLRAAWPRDTRFERRAFGCIRRAYVEARYKSSFRISMEELTWAFERVKLLGDGAARACADHQAVLVAGSPSSLVPLHARQVIGAMPARFGPRTPTLHRSRGLARQAAPPRVGWNRLIRIRRPWRRSRFTPWADHVPHIVIGLCLFIAGAEAAVWQARSSDPSNVALSGPADPSAVLDFDIRADTVLGAIMAIADRAGYRVNASEDIWDMRWTGAYRAKATTFDALADILYGSGLCPVIQGDAITVRYCYRSSPPVVAAAENREHSD